MKLQLSTKRLQINRANGMMVAVLAASSVVTVFSLVISRSLIQQSAYQQKVINERTKASKQIKANLQSVSTLVDKYKEFDSGAENILGANPDPNATGERDGPNSRIILDALPSKYDFPAITTSLEKILTDGGYKIVSIAGDDDEIAQSAAKASSTPSPLEIPFSIEASGSYVSVQKLISDFERSIRPFQLTTLELAGNDANMRITVNAKTYYQPEKSLQVNTKVVK